MQFTSIMALALASSNMCAVHASSKCGDGKGDTCGSDFSTYSCPGKCCHDDFNAWCCPTGPWECHGNYISGSGHCNNDKSCKCTDDTYYVTKVEAQSDPTITYAMAWDLHECCEPSTGTNCGWADGTSVSWTHSQTVSWSNTVTGTLTVKSKESLIVEGVSVEISLSDAYTNGEATMTKMTETIDSPCDGEYSELTHLEFTAQVAVYDVPVTITYESCGYEKTMSGTVKSSGFIGNYECDVTACTTAPYTTCSYDGGCVEARRLFDVIV